MVKLAQVGRSLGWSTISVVVVAGAQLFFMAIMARLLSPADFGLVALGGISLRFATYFAQLGVAPAIIQKPDLNADDIAAGFAVSLVLGLFFTALAVAAAPLAEWFFEMPQLGRVTQGLAISFLIASLGTVAGALLRREMRFKPVAIIEILAYLIGYGLMGLGCAKAGWGVWALVAAALTQGLITSVGAIVVIGGGVLRLKHTANARRHFLSFGSKYSLIGFVEFLSFNVDSIVVGKLVGQAPVGQYNRAMLLANLPVQQPVGILTRVLLPGLASWQSDRVRFTTAVQSALLVVGLYSFTASGFISASAHDIVALLLGPQWTLAADVLAILALGAGPFCISNVAGVTMDAQALLRAKLKLQTAMLICLLLLMYVLTSRYGVIGAAGALVLTEWLRMILYMFMFREQGLMDSRLILVLIGLPCAILITVLFVLGWMIAPMLVGPPVVKLMISGVLSAALAMLILFGARRVLANLPAVRALVLRFPKLGRVFGPAC